MLVLSRRTKEKITFPEVGITVHFIRVQSGTAKVGIDAPINIQIVRDEINRDAAAAADSARKELLRLPRDVRHAIRNELHAISVGLHLYKEQMQLGLRDDALETFEMIMESLRTLDENEVFRRQGTKPSANGRGEEPAKILVVEHEPNERALLAGLLQMQGYDVVAPENGDGALDYLAGGDTPGIVLIDMILPRRDGPSIVRKIRDDQRHVHTKVFAISNTSPEENGIAIGIEGINRWFPKPLNAQFLLDAVAHEFKVGSEELVHH